MHVAFATDAAFLPWTAVAVRSCVDHADALTVHLLHDDTLDGSGDVGRLEAMVRGAGAAFEPHKVDLASLSGLPALDRWGTVVWLRFFLPELLPEVDRALYLDADTLTVSALAPLFAAELDGAPLAAVANVVQPADRARLEALGTTDYRSILNSGVLLLDLDRLRAEGARARLFEIATERAADLVWPDQDALNLAFKGRWHHLHPRWNAQYTLWSCPDVASEVLGRQQVDDARRSPGILHFEGPSLCKPWHALNNHPWRRQWWATLERTPWRDTPAQDRGPATKALRLLPERSRARAYGRLLRWRERRRSATR